MSGEKHPTIPHANPPVSNEPPNMLFFESLSTSGSRALVSATKSPDAPDCATFSAAGAVAEGTSAAGDSRGTAGLPVAAALASAATLSMTAIGSRAGAVPAGVSKTVPDFVIPPNVCGAFVSTTGFCMKSVMASVALLNCAAGPDSTTGAAPAG